MGFFSRSYEPGGVHHLNITDEVFKEAKEFFAENEETRKHFKEIANDKGCDKYEAHDFPVSEIIGLFILSYQFQEEKNQIPENLRITNIQLGRKDMVEYDKFVERYNDRLERKRSDKLEAWEEKGMAGKLFIMAASAAAKGIAKAATGKTESVRWFEKNYADYLCGNSMQAREYLLKYANEFGGDDEGVMAVSNAIRSNFWMAEFAKYNRSK